MPAEDMPNDSDDEEDVRLLGERNLPPKYRGRGARQAGSLRGCLGHAVLVLAMAGAVTLALHFGERLYESWRLPRVTIACEPHSTLTAGTNATCTVGFAVPDGEAPSLLVSKVGNAERVEVLSRDLHAGVYTIRFTATQAGHAGLGARLLDAHATALLQVVPAPAQGKVGVDCKPSTVEPGGTVKCLVTLRDRFGNGGATVQRPPGAGDGYFSVAAVGTASQVAIEDEYVRFVAGAAGRAGVRVTLDGAESSDHVTVEAADDMLSSRKRRRRPQNSD